MSDAKRPSGREIDRLIENYAAKKKLHDDASALAKAAAAVADGCKAGLVDLVEAFGSRHAEKSKRLAGDRHSATTTTGTLVKIDDARVEQFRMYLENSEIPEASQLFFSERVTYQLVDGPSEVLKRTSWPAKVRRKAEQMLALCFTITTKAPSLKVDVA